MTDQDHKQALPPGFRLGSYRVVRVLGVGGFGVTYLCQHTGLGVQVAVKEYLPNEIAVRDGAAVLPKSAGDREGFEWGLSRFLDEARTLARFEHPNVVRVRDCFRANSTAYIVMDYEDGESLDRLLQRLGTLTEAQLKRVVLPVAEGLREVHAAGFLHRDVKPSNIFVRRSDESPVLLDFGSARQALGRKSRSMTAIATAGYSPPEQYERQGAQGAWTDIYALCALCHRAITGEPPVEAPRRTGEVARRRADPQEQLAGTHVVGYSLRFLEAVDSGLRLVETDRPETLDDWLARMEHSTSTGGLMGSRIPGEQGNAEPQGELDDGRHGDDAAPKDARQAALWYRKGAERGLAEAQYNLGVLYDHGEGVPQDTEQAAQWYRKAAEQGHAAAQCNLGTLYEKGLGFPDKDRQAVHWYRKAAEQGHADAQYKLGVLYDIGEGVPNAPGQAAVWYRKAAEQGIAHAQMELAFLYANGRGVPSDARQAVRWYRKAAEQGDRVAKEELGICYYNGEGVAKNAGEAARWWREAAGQGDMYAQFLLGNLYYEGEGVSQDAGEAALWYRKAADRGDPDEGCALAQFSLGLLYHYGEGLTRDAEQAVRWFSTVQRNVLDKLQFLEEYARRESFPHDAVKTSAWLNSTDPGLYAPYYTERSLQGLRAIERGMTYAQMTEVKKLCHELALNYPQVFELDDGRLGRVQTTRYLEAAEQGDARAQFNLGVMYGTGEGVPKDPVRAYAWFNLSTAQGYEDAARARMDLQRYMTAMQIARAQELSRKLVD